MRQSPCDPIESARRRVGAATMDLQRHAKRGERLMLELADAYDELAIAMDSAATEARGDLDVA